MFKKILTGLLFQTLLSTMVLGGTVQEKVDPGLRQYLKQAAAETYVFKDRYDAIVWLTDMSRRLTKKVPDPKQRILILKTVLHEAVRVGIEPELILAVIDVESNFRPYAVSRAGALGLMQVMPFWVKEIGRPKDNLFRIRTNLRYGSTILRFYLDKEKGNRTRALSRYNGSRGKWRYPARVYRALERRWFKQ